MNNELKKAGFSLTEVLLAVGTLAIGLMFIGGTFVAGIHFSTIATERTIAAIVADEAFAKVRIYGVNLALLPDTVCHDFNDVSSVQLNPDEFAYPSTRMDVAEKQYRWSALCRRVGPGLVQVTVFISRKVGTGTTYQGWAESWPVPVPVSVTGVSDNKELTIQNPDQKTFINDGYMIINNETGQLYRVLERYAPPPPDNDRIIRLDLDKVWGPDNNPPNVVWVIPPPLGGGRKPCIAVYQKVIRF